MQQRKQKDKLIRLWNGSEIEKREEEMHDYFFIIDSIYDTRLSNAKRIYENRDFKATGDVRNPGFIKRLIGVEGLTTMVKTLK